MVDLATLDPQELGSALAKLEPKRRRETLAAYYRQLWLQWPRAPQGVSEKEANRIAESVVREVRRERGR